MSTPHERMRPAFASNRSLVVIPFRSRVVPQLPKSHRQVNRKRFGNRFTEVVYLHTSDKMSPIHMFDMMSHKVMIVSDFRHSCLKSDTVGYPTNSLSATSTAQYTHPEIDNMHTLASHDDKVVSDQQKQKALIRSQTRVSEVVNDEPFAQD